MKGVIDELHERTENVIRAIFSEKPRDVALSYLSELKKFLAIEDYSILDNIGMIMKKSTDQIAKEMEKGDLQIENIYRFSWDYKPVKDYKLLLVNEGEI